MFNYKKTQLQIHKYKYILQIHNLNYKNENINKYNGTKINEKIQTNLQGNSQRNISKYTNTNINTNTWSVRV